MNHEILNEYAVVSKCVEDAKVQLEAANASLQELRPKVLESLRADGVTKLQAPVGTFSVVPPRKSWKYSDSYEAFAKSSKDEAAAKMKTIRDEAEAALELMRAEEQIAKVAVEIEGEPTLRFQAA